MIGASPGRLSFVDGGSSEPAAVVWATGFRAHYPWLRVPVLDERGAPVHSGGVTSWPGLYYLGLPWQRTRGSAVLGWVGRDAEALAGPIVALAGRTPARLP